MFRGVREPENVGSGRELFSGSGRVPVGVSGFPRMPGILERVGIRIIRTDWCLYFGKLTISTLFLTMGWMWDVVFIKRVLGIFGNPDIFENLDTFGSPDSLGNPSRAEPTRLSRESEPTRPDSLGNPSRPVPTLSGTFWNFRVLAHLY